MSDDVEWGPWINNAHPTDGMYIQIKAINIRTNQVHFHEGVVFNSDAAGFNTMPDINPRGLVWQAWRERKPKGLTILQDILREVERSDELV